MTGQTIRRKAHGTFFNRLTRKFRDLSNLVSGRGFFNRAFTHNVKTCSTVSHQTADIDRWPQRLKGIEVSAIRFPIPWQAVQYRVLWDVFNGLHHAGKKFPISFLARRERDSAITQ